MSDFPIPDPGLQALIAEYRADIESVKRRYRLSLSPQRIARMERLATDFDTRISALPFERLSVPAQIDYVLSRNCLARTRQELAQARVEALRVADFLPFAPTIFDLDEAMTSMQSIDPQQAGTTLNGLGQAMSQVEPPSDAIAIECLNEMRSSLERWRAFYVGYDPVLDWWIRQPLKVIAKEFERLVQTPPEAGAIPGHPVGRDALLQDLRFEMLPYTPEELIAIGDREYDWCLVEMRKAAGELGFGDDWRAALEHVKNTYVPPGEQPRIVRELALEAIDYVESMVTIPDLAKETWRMEMMTPKRQKVNPFFLGGEAIIVSYPTDTMTHEEKMMSMRGNNPNFSRATVQHELIPGHHLQMYMTDRFRPYRQLFSTPFWIEGWTLYWELLLWELGFPDTPERRIGMLFWRMHRCVRVSFSLRFHLGELTTAECVDILVDRVGHERLNAEGEVRRSFNRQYPPLYQAAYLIGGLQFQSISRELRAKGWSFRDVHDAMMRENEMPPAMMRLALLGESPKPDGGVDWRFDSPS